MSFSDDCQDDESHVDATRERAITLSLGAHEAAIVHALARRLELTPADLVRVAVHSLAESERSLARR